MNWQYYLIVASGGAMGACCRYAVSSFFLPRVNLLPWPTLIVNVSGSLLAGLFLVMFSERFAPSALFRLFIFTGFLGAFTTFSAFSAENLFYFQQQQWLKLSANILLNNAGALTGVLAGGYVALYLMRG